MSHESKDTILLLGGTGKVASRIAPLLSSNGNRVLVASRSGTSPQLPNTEGIKFDWFDLSTFFSALEITPVAAVFMITPTLLHPLPIMKPFIDLAVSKGVKRFVLLSSSMIDSGGEHLMGKVSEYLISLKVDYAILRPSWFMQNFSEVQHLTMIRDKDMFITATGEGKVPFISANDIAAVAFRALTDEVSHNTDHFILGPDLLSYDEVADLLSAELGRKISHAKISEAEWAAGITAFGVPEAYANALAEMETKIKEGKEERMNNVVFEVTGKKPISFKDFIAKHKSVWERE